MESRLMLILLGPDEEVAESEKANVFETGFGRYLVRGDYNRALANIDMVHSIVSGSRAMGKGKGKPTRIEIAYKDSEDSQ